MTDRKTDGVRMDGGFPNERTSITDVYIDPERLDLMMAIIDDPRRGLFLEGMQFPGASIVCIKPDRIPDAVLTGRALLEERPDNGHPRGPGRRHHRYRKGR